MAGVGIFATGDSLAAVRFVATFLPSFLAAAFLRGARFLGLAVSLAPFAALSLGVASGFVVFGSVLVFVASTALAAGFLLDERFLGRLLSAGAGLAALELTSLDTGSTVCVFTGFVSDALSSVALIAGSFACFGSCADFFARLGLGAGFFASVGLDSGASVRAEEVSVALG